MKKFIQGIIFINIIAFSFADSFSKNIIQELLNDPAMSSSYKSKQDLQNDLNKALEAYNNDLDVALLETNSEKRWAKIAKAWQAMVKIVNAINSKYDWMSNTIHDLVFTKKGLIKTGLVIFTLYPVMKLFYPISFDNLILNLLVKYGRLKGAAEYVLEINKQIGSIEGFWGNLWYHPLATTGLIFSKGLNWATRNSAESYVKARIK